MTVNETTTLNVRRGINKTSRITWNEFKFLLEQRGWSYDSETQQVTFLVGGKRRKVTRYMMDVLATCYGFYEPLENYINDS
jgi:hypothetical protein